MSSRADKTAKDHVQLRREVQRWPKEERQSLCREYQGPHQVTNSKEGLGAQFPPETPMI